MSKIREGWSHLVDHPTTVTWTIAGALTLYWVVSGFFVREIAPTVAFAYLDLNSLREALTTLALGVAGVAAMVGGFAGVVVVFGLSSNDERFRQVRTKAATSLRRNWMSIVTTPLVAAFLAIVCAVLATVGVAGFTIWLLLFSLLLTAHGAARLVVLLMELVKVVHQTDLQSSGINRAERESDTIVTDDFLGP